MAHNNIEDMLDYLRRIKSGDDLNSDEVGQIERLGMKVRLLRTFIKYHHLLSPDSLVKITKMTKLVGERLHEVFGGYTNEYENKPNVEMLVSQLLEFIEGNCTSLRYSYELNDSYFLEYMDCVVTNLYDVLMYLKQRYGSPNLEFKRFLKQVKIIKKKMGFLRYLYNKEINGYVDHEKLEGLETRIRFMVDNVGQFCFDLWFCRVDYDTSEDEDVVLYADEDDFSGKPPYLLCLIVLVELEIKKIFLGELNTSKLSQSRTFEKQKVPKCFSHHLRSLLMHLRAKTVENVPDRVSARNIEVSIELLGFLIDVPSHVIYGKMLIEVMEKVGALVGDVLCFIMKDDMCKISPCSIQILEKIENLKEQVLERYYKTFKFTLSKFPTVGGLSFLDSLLRKLNEMLKSESALDFMMNPQVGILERDLSSLISIFKDVAEVHHENDAFKDLERRTIRLAYEGEVAIDSIHAQHNALWHLSRSLPTIIQEIKHISAEVTKMLSENIALRACTMIKSSRNLRTQHSDPVNADEEIVGFEDDKKGSIIQHLIQRKDELDVLPIVGMAGIGKTTFARKLFNDCMIVSHFDSRAWCCISQAYNRRDLLQEIFRQVSGSMNKIDNVDKLADMLRKVLIGKRYLIVLDDMWDVMAWDDLKLSFPNGRNGSRIVVTTRLEKVGEHAKQHTNPYPFPFLTSEESRELLHRKVFQNEDCPPELQDVSREVAKRCNGLPLVVVLMAGMIKKRKTEESWWREVKDSLFSSLGESEEYSLSTVQLSYSNLRDYLRPCLLYMGMFKEDARVPVPKLISLWIAEGLLQNIEFGRLEETAEDYLRDLISSNVVMVSKRRCNGKVKYCQVHDVVHQFCLEKSREENFMLAMNGHFQPLHLKETRMRFHVTDDSNVDLLGSRTRVIINQQLRLLIVTEEGMTNPFPCVSKFRLLKVLELGYYWFRDPFTSATLHLLIHLKYLSVHANEFIFSPESHPRYLETLMVECYHEFVVSHATFWKMEKLRHVEVGGYRAIFDFRNNKIQIFEGFSKLESLRILRGIKFLVDDAYSMDVLLQGCPNLQDLKMSIFFYKYSSILKLDSVMHLQSLHLSFDGRNIIFSELYLPSTLTKLVLERPHRASMASLIAGLPSLEYLTLSDSIYELEEWCLGDITFDKLKFLKLKSCGISRWDASGESFPRLETLVIKWCQKLEEIPLGFADVQTLKQIKLIGPNRESLEASAVKIKEEVEAIEGCERIDLIIKLQGMRSLPHRYRQIWKL